MADRAILHYTEEIERLKEKARLIARREAQSIDFEEALDDPDAFQLALLAILVNFLDSVFFEAYQGAVEFSYSVGLSADPNLTVLRADIEAAISDAEEELAADIEEWSDDLATQLEAIEDSGLDEETVEASTRNGSPLATISIAALASALAHTASQSITSIVGVVEDSYLESNASESQLYQWVTVEDKKRCQGAAAVACEHRHGLVKTLAEWEKLGLPRAQNLMCQILNGGEEHCRCKVVPPVDFAGGPVNVKEAIRRGRERGQSEA